jgi:TolB-like protein/Flp pilus assembly protein TadD
MAEHGKSENHQAPNGEAAATSARVFISYASHDAALAQKVCSTLEAASFHCWIAPRDVVPGTLYADGIVGAIDESRILILILSKEAVASAHVGRELERATSKRHPIIALRTDTAPLNRAFEYFLNQSQWIEVGTGGTDGAIAKLVEAVGRHLAPGTATASTYAPQTPVAKAATPRRAWLIAGAIIAVVLAGACFLVTKGSLSKREATASTAAVTDKSIAVLPFVDMSEKKDQEYFADGMAEEIIDLLVKIPGLKVIGRTSSFQFKGKTEDLRKIGKQLGVAYVLEGSVRKSGDHLRVTAQLINTKDGAHLWSQTYDRDLSDVLKMQDEIAAQVVVALQIEVSAANDIASHAALRNPEAYTLVLQGLHAMNRQDQRGLEQALSDFQRAFDLDPAFADAAVGMGYAYDILGEYYYMPAPEAFEKARRGAEQALKLDPNNVGAHALLANIHFIYDWDWAAVESELKRARELAPNDSLILFLAGQQSRIMGRWDDALKLMNASLELDPLGAVGYEVLSFIQVRRGRLVEAEAAIRRTLELSPTFGFAHYSLGTVLLVRGQGEAALAEYLKEPDERARIAGSAIAYFALGRKADSNTALARWLTGAKDFPYTTATIYAFRGELDEAFKWLERAYAQKDVRLPFIKGEPTMKKLEGDPRYKAFLKKLNLPE